MFCGESAVFPKIECMLEHLKGAEARISDIIKRFEGPELSQQKSAKIGRENQLSQTRPPENRGKTLFDGELEKLIEQASVRNGVSPEIVRAVVAQESGGQKDAVSSAGALGLMQLMPETAKGLGVNPRIPAENLDGGVRFLKSMALRFGNLDQALAAYNAGPGAVEKYGGVPPYSETVNYVKKIRQILREIHA
ncbi:MAG: lytic transglycosylase domain-containing protein [Spirochaetia bacterium]|nr:lytic transglycosylase domain-containing protein [Spirochaetia bacterium]